MADQLDRKFADEVRRVAGTGDGSHFPVMSGKVVAGSQDMDTLSCNVLFTVDGVDKENATPVSINVITSNAGGFYGVPADDAYCLVAEIDGPGKWELLKASAYTKVMAVVGGSKLDITDGLIKLNDGSKGGLTITPELKTQLDKTNSLLSHLVAVINGAPIPEPGSGASSALQLALKSAITTDTLGDFSNIENTAIKHG